MLGLGLKIPEIVIRAFRPSSDSDPGDENVLQLDGENLQLDGEDLVLNS